MSQFAVVDKFAHLMYFIVQMRVTLVFLDHVVANSIVEKEITQQFVHLPSIHHVLEDFVMENFIAWITVLQIIWTAQITPMDHVHLAFTGVDLLLLHAQLPIHFSVDLHGHSAIKRAVSTTKQSVKMLLQVIVPQAQIALEDFFLHLY
jgi:hypothetical protein